MSDQKQILELLAKVDKNLESLRGDFDAFVLKQDERWNANDKRWDANEKRWDANDRRWDANDKRWDANDKRMDAFEASVNSRFDGIASLFLASERSHGKLETRVDILEKRVDKLDPPMSQSA